jgi:hypothetical protein
MGDLFDPSPISNNDDTLLEKDKGACKISDLIGKDRQGEFE